MKVIDYTADVWQFETEDALYEFDWSEKFKHIVQSPKIPVFITNDEQLKSMLKNSEFIAKKDEFLLLGEVKVILSTNHKIQISENLYTYRFELYCSKKAFTFEEKYKKSLEKLKKLQEEMNLLQDRLKEMDFRMDHSTRKINLLMDAIRETRDFIPEFKNGEYHIKFVL